MAFTGSWGLLQYHKLGAQASHLESENQRIRATLENQREKTRYLTHELMEVRKKTRVIKGFLGMEGGNGKTKLGQGGLELSPQSLPFTEKVQGSNSHRPRFPVHLSPADMDDLKNDLQAIVGALNEKQERLACTPSISPVDHEEAWLSSSYGNRISPFTGKKQFHPGIDIAGRKGTPILSTAKGVVTFVGKNGPMGLTVKVVHDSTYQTLYGHLLKAAVKKGQSVGRGEIIGYMGHSGRSTGYHVHYGIERNGKSINPYPYMMDWNDA